MAAGCGMSVQSEHCSARKAAREAAYIAQHAPILATAYTADPERLFDALGDVAMRLPLHPALLAALQSRSVVEIGVQLQIAMDHELADRAQDDAAEAFYQAHPEAA